MKNYAGYIKIEGEAVINKNGEAVNWHELSEQDPSHWTSEVPTIMEIDEEHKTVKELGKLALNTFVPYDPIPPDAKKGDIIRGYKIVERRLDAENRTKELSAAFAPITNTETETYIRNRKELNKTADTPRVYESQKAVARFYVGALPGDTEPPAKSLAIDYSKYYSAEDAAYVNRRREQFRRGDEMTDRGADLIAGKVMEGMFRPLVSTGFFDYNSFLAALVHTSEYDDIAHGADVAVSIPIPTGNNPLDIKSQLLCFDLTVGSGNSKVSRIYDEFQKGHGFTTIKYPFSNQGQPLPKVESVPHFALCLPRKTGEFAEYCAKLAAGHPVTPEIHRLINYEIYKQADAWARYYKSPAAHSDEKHQIFRDLARHFQNRLRSDLGNQWPHFAIDSIAERHPAATRFLAGLSLPQPPQEK